MLKESVLLSYLSNGLIIISIATINDNGKFIYNNLPTVVKVKRGQKNRVNTLNSQEEYEYEENF